MGGLIAELPRQAWWDLGLRLAGLEVEMRFRKLAHALGWRRSVEVSEADLLVPDSDLCTQATHLVRSLSPDFLVEHCLRTYVFGCALARRDGLSFDRELLYLAAVMHDLGLTQACQGPRAFEVEGADRAYQFLLEHQVPNERAEAVHQAIVLHARVGLTVRHTREGALLQAGAGLDVVGLRAEDLSQQGRQRVVQSWPRRDFKSQFSQLLRNQWQCKPHCNIAAHVDLGFLGRIAKAPFDE